MAPPKGGRKTFVVGVGMSKFMKPQKAFNPDLPDYPEFAKTAVLRALDDACIKYNDIEMAREPPSLS